VNIFISHAERDRAYATALGQALRDAGQRVWEPQGVQPGENWGLKSGEALAGADVVIVLLSPDSVATEWVRREIEFAISSPRFKGRLIPILLRPTRDVPWILRELPQWLESNDPTRAAKEIVNILSAGHTVTKARAQSQDVKNFMTSFVDLAYREAKRGEFAVPGLGKLVKQKRKARVGRNRTTRAAIKTPAKTGLKSRVTKPAKGALLGGKK